MAATLDGELAIQEFCDQQGGGNIFSGARVDTAGRCGLLLLVGPVIVLVRKGRAALIYSFVLQEQC